MESRESIESMGVMGNIQVTKSMLIMETLEAMSTMETKEAMEPMETMHATEPMEMLEAIYTYGLGNFCLDTYGF